MFTFIRTSHLLFSTSRLLPRFALILLGVFLLIGLRFGHSSSQMAADNSLQNHPRLAAFVIELETAPLAEVYAQSLRQSVRAAEVASITQAQLADVEEQQTAVLSALETLDATVIYRTQRVLNSIAIRIDPAKLGEVRGLPGVRAIYPLIPKVPHHAISLPLIGAPDLWQGVKGSKLTGEGVRVAVIDTGIDYIHSDLGGTGDSTLYTIDDPTVISDAMPFPNSKVIGGYDFVGESYDADP